MLGVLKTLVMVQEDTPMQHTGIYFTLAYTTWQ